MSPSTQRTLNGAGRLVLGVVLAATASCSREGRQAAEPRPLRFAYQNRVGSAIPIIAVEKDLFGRHGVTVESSRFSSGPACAESLYTGAADIGAMGDTTCVLALARRAPLRILTSHASGEHRHRVIVAETSPYESLRDLRGHRIAIKKGTSTYGGFLKFLESKGMTPNAIDVVDLKPHTMPEALAAGSIQAFAASEPTPSLGEMRGGRELATFGGLGNNYPIMMLVAERLVRERPEQIPAFLKALQDAETFLKEHRPEAVELVAAAVGLPPDVTARAMDRHEFRLGVREETLNSLQETARFLRDQDLIEDVPDLRTLDLAEE